MKAVATATLVSHSMEGSSSLGFTESMIVICGDQFPGSESITPALCPHPRFLCYVHTDFFFIFSVMLLSMVSL